MGREITKEQMLLYVRHLSDFSEAQLRHGFDRAIKEFTPGYGINFPYIGVLRDWCLSYPPPDASVELLTRPAKPDDLTDEEREAYSKELVVELQEKIKGGTWAMPGGDYALVAELLAAERNGKSEVPADKEERRPWAKQKAKEQGWT